MGELRETIAQLLDGRSAILESEMPDAILQAVLDHANRNNWGKYVEENGYIQHRPIQLGDL